MKEKNNFSWFVTILILFIAIGSCQRPEEIDLNPKVILMPQGPSDFLTTDDTLKIRIRITALDGFQYFRIQEVNTGVIFSIDQGDFPEGNFLDSNFVFPMNIYQVRDTLIYEFLVQDGKQRTGTNSLQLVIDKNIDSTYGDFSSPYFPGQNSFYSSGLDTGFTLFEAGLVSEKIDIGFHYIFESLMIAAPADSLFSQVYVPEISNWTTLNQTLLFSTNKTKSNFISLSSDGPVFETFKDPVSSLDDLKVGEVLSFFTVDSLAGWILIDKIREDLVSKELQISVSIKIGR